MAWAYDQSGITYDQSGIQYDAGGVVVVAPPGGITLVGVAPLASSLVGMQPSTRVTGAAATTGALVGMASSSSLRGAAPAPISLSMTS